MHRKKLEWVLVYWFDYLSGPSRTRRSNIDSGLQSINGKRIDELARFKQQGLFITIRGKELHMQMIQLQNNLQNKEGNGKGIWNLKGAKKNMD
ncbi:hypothetical protein WA026_014936 [Henosepilachna vigintioctopunctata]|uniref:Uncharacterized protein n=1 Tax=Henosepilachna vigintioctopunctata TaxID=420089 RepID=A0AAW1UTI7_9CUCU